MAMVISDIEKREMIIRLLDGFGLNSDQKTNATIGLPDKTPQDFYLLRCTWIPHEHRRKELSIG